MIKIKEAIVVEGVYDKVKLTNLFDTMIVPTGGFDVFKNKNTQNLIKKLAVSRGIIVFTDCDRAGFVIRSFIKNIGKNGVVKHAYIPEIVGKEKRKKAPSKEGFLGVEGIDDDIITAAIKKCSTEKTDKKKRLITKADLFADGLSGGENSYKYRKVLTNELDLPHRISTNMLIDVINSLYDYDEYKAQIERIRGWKSNENC